MSKVGIVGVGMVGRAAASAMVSRGSCRELVLVDVRREVAEAVALDLRYGIPTGPPLSIRSGTNADLKDADLVAITAGANEKSGGATDKSDAQGRLRLLGVNAGIFQAIVPEVVAVAPKAVLLVVADPPDPLADLTRTLARHDRVVSTGTFLDSLRFATHLAQVLGVNPASVSAQVFGEHGMSEVLVWSAATIGGVPLADVLQQRKLDATTFRSEVESAVRSANINIIAGIGASQYGIGAVTARLTEAILRDERIVAVVGSHQAADGVTYSLPSVIGAGGVQSVLAPKLESAEREALNRSIATLQKAVATLPK
ncbi:lactate/malate family dehydrogenase [Lacipirellula sp.]|uniref:lactate/malate family dehydrogenase n=1 Tax=Lacipirellula sp. TaxID=2691419 RepID=UPI003D137523